MIRMDKREYEALKQADKEPIDISQVKLLLEKSGRKVIEIKNPRKRGAIRYSDIEKNYSLTNRAHIIWIKFAKVPKDDRKERYVGVVGAGCDINKCWDGSNTSGRLVIEKAKLEWDESVVFVIPIPGLSKECKGHYTKERNREERIIGTIIADATIPIIDYYSHLN